MSKEHQQEAACPPEAVAASAAPSAPDAHPLSEPVSEPTSPVLVPHGDTPPDPSPSPAASAPDAEASPDPGKPSQDDTPDTSPITAAPIEMGPMVSPEAAPEDPTSAAQVPPETAKPGFFRQHRLAVILTSVFLLLAIAAGAVTAYCYVVIHPYASYDKILPNVYCAGVNLGGMTQQEAQTAIEDALRNPANQINLILPDCTYTFQPRQEGITLNGAEIAQEAYDYGRTDLSAYGMYRAYRAASKSTYRLTAETDLVYQAEDIQNLAVQIYQETRVSPTASTASFDEATHEVTVTLGTPGHQIPPKAIYDALCAAFDAMDFSDITMDYVPVEIDQDALRTLCLETASGFEIPVADPVTVANQETHSIDLTMGTQGWSLDEKALYDLAEDAVREQRYGQVCLAMTAVEPAEVDITPAYHELACNPTEPYYYAGDVQEGLDGYTLDWEAAITQILDSTYGQQLNIPMTPIPPKHTAAEVRAVLFRDQLSSYSTPHPANSNRTHNLALACEAMDGTVINPGETFSFNDVVGERTAAKGYREAIVYVGSESKDEVGGGICQVASTIYDAALYAEMTITSRACHTFFVTYVPGGLDATVYWGSLDFCFRNDTDYPIRVNASVSGGYVNISIDGTKTNDHVVKLSSTCLSTVPYSTVYRQDSSKPAGYEEETTYPYTGYTYEAYQYIYDGNGNLLETNYLGKSTYDKRDRVITVGTG